MVFSWLFLWASVRLFFSPPFVRVRLLFSPFVLGALSSPGIFFVEPWGRMRQERRYMGA